MNALELDKGEYKREMKGMPGKLWCEGRGDGFYRKRVEWQWTGVEEEGVSGSIVGKLECF